MRLVALDVETFLIKPGLLAPPLVCVSWACDGEFGLLDHKDGPAYVRDVLRGGCHLVLHNGVFDLAVLCEAKPSLIPLVFEAYAAGRIWDTKIREELRDIADGRQQKNGNTFVYHDGEMRRADYSLAGLVRRYLDKDRSFEKSDPSSWRLRYGSLHGVPIDQWPQDARDYSIEDATDTLEVFEEQGGIVGAHPTEAVQNQAAWALHLMSCWGLRTNKDAVDPLEAELLVQQKKNQRYLIKAGFLVPERCTPSEVEEGKAVWWETVEKSRGVTKKYAADNLATCRQVDGAWREFRTVNVPYRWKRDSKRIQAYVERVFRKMGQEAPRTDTGISTDKDTCYLTPSRLLHLVADGGGVDKILGTYIPVLRQGTEIPINPRFNVLVNTGRTSCAEPNIQNLPSGKRKGQGQVRTCFVARPGWVYSSTDYNTLELCALAEVILTLGIKSKMAEVINSGKDLHSQMGADMLGISYEDFELERKAEKKAGVKGRATKARDAAKVANFGLPGGLGVQSLIDYARGYDLRFTYQESAALVREWRAAWPEMTAYFQWINDLVGYGSTKMTHPVTGFIRGGVGYCDGCNQQFQHLAALGAKMACFQVAWECYVDLGTALFGSRPVGFIHDEIIAEHPEEIASDANKRLAEVMVTEMSKVITKVRIKATPTLMRAWRKEAEPIYNEAGDLVPWEDRLAKAA